MKNLFLLLFVAISCKSFPQTNCSQYTILPLRTYTDIPEDQCYYLKDTTNELQAFVGTWKGTWNNKIIYITFKKITNKYDSHFKYSKDLLIAKFKVISSNGVVLFNNTTTSDDTAKINGGKFIKDENKYSLPYNDNDLCKTRGRITIAFTNATKTQLEWKYIPSRVTIFQDCFFYNYPINQYPDPLPKNIILTKQ